MAEPFILKSGATMPALPVTLIGDDGEPPDLSGLTVTATMVSEIYPYTAVFTDSPATVEPDQVANRGQVYYAWVDGDTDVPGDYLVEWTIVEVGKVQIVPGDDYTRVQIVPSLVSGLPPLVPLVSLGEIETAMGRPMTAVERGRAGQLVEEVTASIEVYLNRVLRPATFANERHHAVNGRLSPPLRYPVIAVDSVTIGYDGSPTTDYNVTWADTYWPPGPVWVTYRAGDATAHPSVEGLVRDVVARSVLADPVVASGIISGYSVEGTSITYSRPTNWHVENTGLVTVGELNGIKRLRIPVVG